jgi:hypothetical protein
MHTIAVIGLPVFNNPSNKIIAKPSKIKYQKMG